MQTRILIVAFVVIFGVLAYNRKLAQTQLLATKAAYNSKTDKMGKWLPSMPSAARGMRNNNPGNIEKGQGWQGEVPLSQNSEKRFAQFYEMRFGVRAMYKLLHNYITGRVGDKTRKFNTIRLIINRWAPENGVDENGNSYTQDSLAYIDHVAKLSGVNPDVVIATGSTEHKLVMEAMMIHETGGFKPNQKTINEGIALFG